MIYNVKSAFEKRPSFEGLMTGYVVMNDDDNMHSGVVIPKVMPHIPLGEKSTFYTEPIEWKLTPSPSIINSEDIDFNELILEQNFAWVNHMEWIRDFVHIHDQMNEFGRDGHMHPDTKDMTEVEHLHSKNDRQIANHFSNTQPSVHEEVLCYALDGDPQKMYWLPFAPSLYGS